MFTEASAIEQFLMMQHGSYNDFFLSIKILT